VATSTVSAAGSRLLRQSTTPSRREKIEVNDTLLPSFACDCSQLSLAQSPEVQSRPIIVRSPARRSTMTMARSKARTECTAPGASIGLPIVMMPSTRSGRRTAMLRASSPPRLWPMIVTLRSRLITMDSMRRSSAEDACCVQPTFACMVER